MSTLLEVRGLNVSFDAVRVVHDIDLTLERGETLGIVGETGSGKSVSSSALMGLLPVPPARVRAATLSFDGRSLLRGNELDLRAVGRERGRGMAMIFQDPSSALNPLFTIGDVLMAVIRRHRKLRGTALRTCAVELLEAVGLPSPSHILDSYPHQLSGGMKQRTAIAMTLAAKPSLLIADEPTTALDATVATQVLALLADLQRESGVAMLFISHDLGVVSRVCSRVAVMYAGRIVEEAPVDTLFRAPSHPYTRGLFAARPHLRLPSMLGERRVEHHERRALLAIPGSVPTPAQLPAGCAFHPRCYHATADCNARVPVLETLPTPPQALTGHSELHPARVACFHPVLNAPPQGD